MPSDTSGVGGGPPARLEVRLLGIVEIILDGRRLRAFNSLRLQRFLALIAIRRDLQHRSRLAFELWPDSNERQARTNLRKLLHDFRHARSKLVALTDEGRASFDAIRHREAGVLEKLPVEVGADELGKAANILRELKTAFEHPEWLALIE